MKPEKLLCFGNANRQIGMGACCLTSVGMFLCLHILKCPFVKILNRSIVFSKCVAVLREVIAMTLPQRLSFYSDFAFASRSLSYPPTLIITVFSDILILITLLCPLSLSIFTSSSSYSFSSYPFVYVFSTTSPLSFFTSCGFPSALPLLRSLLRLLPRPAAVAQLFTLGANCGNLFYFLIPDGLTISVSLKRFV